MFRYSIVGRTLVLTLCGFLAGCGNPTKANLSEEYATELLQKNGLDAESGLIERVIRSENETIVWVSTQHSGLPVFFTSVGYSFEADGSLTVQTGTSEPMLLGEPAAPASAFPADHQPDISIDEAEAVYLARIQRESGPGSYYDGHSPSATLGFHNLRLGRSDTPEYRLAWRLKPEESKHPVAVIDAKKGEVLYFDSGVRTSNPPRPVPPVAGGSDSPPPWPEFVGQWWSAHCASREYKRVIHLYADQTFSATDLVAPCPEGAMCIWSGIVERRGTWLQRGAGLIELAQLVPAQVDTRRAVPQGEPLPGALSWDPEAQVLREAVPGNSATCDYQRAKPADATPLPITVDPENPVISQTPPTCREAVQDQIAWNKQGNRHWNENNIAKLCRNVDSPAPAECFDHFLSGAAIPTAEDWHWQETLALCSGTIDSAKIIECIAEQTVAGLDRPSAIAACRLRL